MEEEEEGERDLAGCLMHFIKTALHWQGEKSNWIKAHLKAKAEREVMQTKPGIDKCLHS